MPRSRRSRLTANVTVCFDGDSADVRPRKAIYLLTEAGLNCQAVLLPGKYDPDDYLKAYGASKLKEYLTDNRLNGIDYLYAVEKDELEPTDITSIERFKNNVFRHLAFFNSAVINELYLKKMAADLQVSIETLQNDFKRSAARPTILIRKPDKPLPIRRATKKLSRIRKRRDQDADLLPRKYLEAKENSSLILRQPSYPSILFKLFDYYERRKR